jgi:uncharacterized membrane protein YfcA
MRLLLNCLVIIFAWLAWLLYTFPDSKRLLEQNWPISLTMIFGSFIAGATSEGGGAVAFPVFTKLLNISPQDAKIFSLAIQSIGMIAASLTIIMLRIAIPWRLVFWISLGGIAGIIFSSLCLAPLFSAALLKVLFTALVSSFALTLFVLGWRSRQYNRIISLDRPQEKVFLLLIGIAGGCMTGLVGNGIDIISFSVMILLFRLSEKIATPTSVILMAINALVGFLIHWLWLDQFSDHIQQWWLAAIPVVIIGAPLGAYCCSRLDNKLIAMVLIGLIVIELISTLILVPVTPKIMIIAVSAFLFFLLLYYSLLGISRYQPDKPEIST